MNRSNRNKIIREQVIKSLSSLLQLDEESKHPIVWRLHNLWNEKLRPYSRTSSSMHGSYRWNNDVPEYIDYGTKLFGSRRNPYNPKDARSGDIPRLEGMIGDFRHFHNNVGLGFDEKELPEIRSVLMDAHLYGMRKVLQRNSMKPEEYRSALEEGGLDILHPKFNNHVKELTGLSVPETTRKRKSNPEFGDQQP